MAVVRVIYGTESAMFRKLESTIHTRLNHSKLRAFKVRFHPLFGWSKRIKG